METHTLCRMQSHETAIILFSGCTLMSDCMWLTTLLKYTICRYRTFAHIHTWRRDNNVEFVIYMPLDPQVHFKGMIIRVSQQTNTVIVFVLQDKFSIFQLVIRNTHKKKTAKECLTICVFCLQCMHWMEMCSVCTIYYLSTAISELRFFEIKSHWSNTSGALSINIKLQIIAFVIPASDVYNGKTILSLLTYNILYNF